MNGDRISLTRSVNGFGTSPDSVETLQKFDGEAVDRGVDYLASVSPFRDTPALGVADRACGGPGGEGTRGS